MMKSTNISTGITHGLRFTSQIPRCIAFDDPPAVEPFWPAYTTSAIPTHTWSLVVQRPESLEYAHELVVDTVEFCKAKKGFRHEFLIISLRHRSKRLETCFLVERGQLVGGGTQTYALSATSGFFCIPHLKSSRPAANDLVFTAAKGQRGAIHTYAFKSYGPYQTLATLTPTRDFSAAQLSVLLEIPRKLKPQYDIYESQCYWYADCVYRAIQYLSRATEKKDEGAEDMGRLFGLGVTAPNKELENVLGPFKAGWKEFCRKWDLAERAVGVQEEEAV